MHFFLLKLHLEETLIIFLQFKLKKNLEWWKECFRWCSMDLQKFLKYFEIALNLARHKQLRFINCLIPTNTVLVFCPFVLFFFLSFLAILLHFTFLSIFSESFLSLYSFYLQGDILYLCIKYSRSVRAIVMPDNLNTWQVGSIWIPA